MSQTIVNILAGLAVAVAFVGVIFRRKGWSWTCMILPWILFAGACLVQKHFLGVWINMGAMLAMWVMIALKLGWFRLRHRTEINVTIGPLHVEHSSQSDEKP